jgi:thiosulfate/3-mercaptopyruvate sulfurtransferase
MFTCGSGVTACINMIAYELVSDLKKFMMDLGPNGDKRKLPIEK